MSDCEGKCEDCQCESDEVTTEVTTEVTPEEPDHQNLQAMNLEDAVEQMVSRSEENKISIDQDNADLYAFSSIDLRTLRGKGEVTTSPLDWSQEEIKNVAHQVVGNKLKDV